jgi:hypothetical protein
LYKNQGESKKGKKAYEKGHIKCLCGSHKCRKYVYPSYS